MYITFGKSEIYAKHENYETYVVSLWESSCPALKLVCQVYLCSSPYDFLYCDFLHKKLVKREI